MDSDIYMKLTNKVCGKFRLPVLQYVMYM